MKKSRSIALAGVFSALAIVLMWAGALTGFGTYASPLLAGIALIPVGLALGRKYHLLAFIAVSLLCPLLSADWEMNLLFTALFGWYPILRPTLEKLKNPLRLILKFLIFNVLTIGIEMLVMLVIMPSAEQPWLLLMLLALGNLTFYYYDYVLPRIELALSIKLRIGG